MYQATDTKLDLDVALKVLGERYDREMHDVLAVQEEIARAVVDNFYYREAA